MSLHPHRISLSQDSKWIESSSSEVDNKSHINQTGMRFRRKKKTYQASEKVLIDQLVSLTNQRGFNEKENYFL